MKLKATIISLISIFIVGLTAILLYAFWPAIKGTVDKSRYYTEQEVQESYDRGYEDGCKTETELIAQVKYYRDLVDEYYMQVNTLNDEITMLNNHNRDYQAQITNLTNLKLQNESTITNLYTDIESNETKIESLKNEKSQLILNCQSLSSEIDTLRSEINNKDLLINSLTSQANSLQTQIASLEHDKEVLQNDIRDKSSTIDSLNARILELQLSLEYISPELLELTIEKSNLENEKNILENDISRLSSRIVVLENEIENLYGIINDYSIRISSLNATISSLNQQIVDLNSLLLSNSQSSSALNSRIAELERTVAYYEQYISTFESENQIVVTFEFNNSIYNIQVVEKNSIITLADPESTNKVIFNGWTVDDEYIDLSTYRFTTNTKVIADISVKYSITYFVPYQYCGMDRSRVFLVDANTDVTILNYNDFSIDMIPNSQNYVFKGWTINGSDLITVGSSYFVNKDIVLTMVCERLIKVYFFDSLLPLTSGPSSTNGYIKVITVENGQLINPSDIPNIDSDTKRLESWCYYNYDNSDYIDIDLSSTLITTALCREGYYIIKLGARCINPITYKFYFSSTDIVERSYFYNDIVTPPVAPIRDGYQFLGWSTDCMFDNLDVSRYSNSRDYYNFYYRRLSKNGAFVDFENNLRNNVDFYAVYVKVQNVTFVVNNENYSNEVYVWGNSITKPTNPTKDGHTFLGWSEDGVNIISGTLYADTDKVYYAMFR